MSGIGTAATRPRRPRCHLLWLLTRPHPRGRTLVHWYDGGGPDGAKVPVVVIDRAGYHTATKRCRQHAVALPAELPSAERLWPVLREAVANRVLDDLPALSAAITTRGQWMADHPEVVGGAVGDHWAVTA